MEEREKRNRLIGILTSVGVHAALLLLFIFILAWREPDPPLPEYGIEINFGMQEQGSGDVQQEIPVEQEAREEEALPEESASEEAEPEVTEETAVEETVEETSESVEEVIENTQESPEVVEQQPREEKPVQEEKTEPVKQAEPEKKVEQKQNGAKEEGTEKTPAQKSEGDDKDVQGDKGEPEGELNPDAVYKGKPGGGNNGPAVQIVGWMWDEVPGKVDASNENGTVTFEFTIDEDGYVIQIQTKQRSVSPSVAKFYEEQLRNTTFSRTGTGAPRPGNTKGTVTFNIVSR
ncbi:MAG: hypothetical protein P8X57_05660 [Cyclobacteriaceae bacterium]